MCLLRKISWHDMFKSFTNHYMLWNQEFFLLLGLKIVTKYFIRGKIIHFETLDEKLSKNDTLCSSWPGERLYSVWFVFDSALKKLNWQKKVTIWLLQWLSCLFWKVETIVWRCKDYYYPKASWWQWLFYDFNMDLSFDLWPDRSTQFKI